MPFKKGRHFQIYVASRVGYKQRSTGTPILAEARKLERMCLALRDAQEWQLLDGVLKGSINLKDLYAAYVENRLPTLKSDMKSVNLATFLDGWVEWVLANNGTHQTASTYRAQVETLVGTSFLVSELTGPRISRWLTEIPGITTGTRRKYLYALRSFIRYLMERGILDANPAASVRSPKKNAPRLRWETEDNDARIVGAAPAEYQALFAFIKATAAELSAALATLRRDVDLDRGIAHIRGTKTASRNRHEVVIEPWALSLLRQHCRTLTPNAQLWPDITRYQAHDKHQSACAAVEIEDYTLRDSRHSWAVRCRKRGGSLEEIAAQLGHRSILMAATVYAVFKPTLAERRASVSSAM
jgi:integrase